MIRNPAHKSASAAQFTIDTSALVDCYRCGGHVDFDEEGKPYTCYCCCDTGRVPLAQQYEEYVEGVVYEVEHRRESYYDQFPDPTDAAELAYHEHYPEPQAGRVDNLGYDDDIPF